MRALWLLLVLALPVAAGDALATRLDRLAKPYVKGGTVVGLSVGVVAGPDRESLFRGYGKVARDRDATPGPDTVYEIGSISKAFTGVLLALMVQDGSVRLDQPIAELLPERVTVPAHGERRITLVDLATHTAALPRMPANFAPQDPANPFADYTVERMYAFLSGWKLPYPPGEKYLYSNLGVGLLGHALAREADRSYEELLVARIAAPLGLESTRLALTDDLRRRLAPPHDARGRPAANWDIPTLAGAGAIRSTARDMLTFLRANLAPAETPLHAALAQAREVRYRPPRTGGQRMGLGWHIGPNDVHWHNGQTGGYHAMAAVDTKHHRAVVVLANTANGVPDRLAHQILRLLAGEKIARREIEVASDVLASYVGTYRILPTFALTVTHEEGRLMVQATGQPKLQAFATSKTEFFYKVVDARLTFVKDEEGRVTALILHQHGRDLRAPRE
ncbi:MAG: serine hydrolase [Planctomycetota bacterium]|jgi:CubicO group peptidase (beta-lactamase class C family)